MSVSAAATMPPVQDSAVASFTRASRQMPRIVSDRSLNSWFMTSLLVADPEAPVEASGASPRLDMGGGAGRSQAARQTNGGDRLSRDALFAASKSKFLGGGCLDAHSVRRNAQDFRDTRDHGLTVRAHLRPFADQRHVHMSDPPGPPRQHNGGGGEGIVRRG